MRRVLAFVFLFVPAAVFAQANGKLQIHFIDVGQGDSALLVSPLGETVLFDNGNSKDCTKPIAYLDQLGLVQIDYHVASHMHSDHIGCADRVFATCPVQRAAYDHGGSYNTSTYSRYVSAIGAKRTTATKGASFTLDSASATPVTITIAGTDGDGVDTDNENDLSVLAKVSFGDFQAVIGGDLSGFKTDNYEDIESGLADEVGQVEVYKVHHHGSRYSSNQTWLRAIKPRIGIISAGETNNTYGHPTQECLERLHDAGVRTYWTSFGKGAPPDDDFDTVAGTVIVEVPVGAREFTVTGTRADAPTHVYAMWEGGAAPASTPATTWVWSTKSRSNVYHYSTCRWTEKIKPSNRQEATTPPAGKRLHENCPE